MEKLYFITLNYIPNYTLYSKQSVARVIAYGAKRAFEKFRVQSVI